MTTTAPERGHVSYQYVLLRAVPRVDRGEFVNVGVLLYCQAGDLLECRWDVDPVRLAALDPGADVEALRAALDMVDRICRGAEPSGPGAMPLGQRFGWLAAPRSTILQPGPMHAGVTSDTRGEVSRLMTRYVAPPVPEVWSARR